MDVGKNLKTGLFVGLIVSLLFYHVSNQITSQFIQPVGGIYDLMKLIELVTTVVVFFLFIYNKLVTRLILRDGYVGGKYEGCSTHHKQDDNRQSVERFTIAQNLFDVTISGKSFREGSEIAHSVWTGRLFKTEGRTYYFGIDLAAETGEWGIFRLNIEDGEVHGFYYSGKPQTEYAYSFRAKRIEQTPLQRLAEVFQW